MKKYVREVTAEGNNNKKSNVRKGLVVEMKRLNFFLLKRRKMRNFKEFPKAISIILEMLPYVRM